MGECSLAIIDHGLTRLFHWLGVRIGRHPSYFIIIPIFVALLLGTGMQRLIYVNDPEYLFSPVDGAAKHERQVLEDNFPMNYTGGFDPSRFIRAGRFARFFILAQDGGTLLRRHVWKELMKLNEIVHNVTIEFDEETFDYNGICAMWQDACFENDILELDELMGDIEEGKIPVNFPIMFNPETYKTYALPIFFGGVHLSNESTVEKVSAIQLNYFLAVGSNKLDRRGEVWEQAILNAVEAEEGNWKYISVARFTVSTLAQELERNTFSVLPYFSVTAVWMIGFMVITCLMADWVKSKPWLGIVGVISAMLGCLASFGLVMYCGVEFIGINIAAPFLMLGIGIDDTFVMLASWRRTSPHDPVPKRMGETYAEAAVSITITSITDMLSFWVGVITPFPCVQIFSVYSGAAVVATYIWHIFFFGGAIALSGYHEADNRHSIFWWIKTTPRSKSGEKPLYYRLFCSGGIDPNDPYNPKDNTEHMLMVMFRDYWGSFLNLRPVKIVVLSLFICYLGAASYGITKIQEGLERRKLTRYDSYAATFFDLEDLYFRDYPYRIQIVVTGELDYSNKTVQDKIENMMQQFESSPFVGPEGALYTESWLRRFTDYLKRAEGIFDYNVTTQEQFIQVLLEDYISPFSPLSTDINLSEDKKRIMSSRFIIQTVNITGSNEERDMSENLREIARNQTDLNVTVYHPLFVFFDQFLLIRQTSINCVAIAAFIMMGVSLIFIPSPLCSLWVAFAIVSIEAGVVGFMSLWNVNLDAISMMNLIMCIGFSVDFSAHISYAYIAAKVDTPEERVKECLYSLGLPIVQGAISTILGVVALLVAPSYIFITFFKVIFLVIVIAALHGLVLLPVLLSLFGPGSCRKLYAHEATLPVGVLERKNDRVVPYSFVVSPAGLDPKISTDKSRRGSAFGLGLQGGQFVNAGMIPRVTAVKTTKGVAPSSRNSLEKDQGIGTSGEDESSESSLSKTKNKKPLAPKLSHVKELYSNEGYVSDDDGGQPEEQSQQQQSNRMNSSNTGNSPRNINSNISQVNGSSSSSNNKSGANASPSREKLTRSSSLERHGQGSFGVNTNTLPGSYPTANGNGRRKSSGKGSYVSEMRFP